MWINTIIWHLIQNSKCRVQKVKPEIVQVSDLNVQAPVLDECDKF